MENAVINLEWFKGMSDTESARHQSEPSNKPHASGEEALGSREVTVAAREATVVEREKATARREDALRAPADVAHARAELNALMGQVREANEHLVVVNLRSQTLAEEAEHSPDRCALRGHISVDNRPGHGSTFSVAVPRILWLTPSNKAADAIVT